MYPIIDANAATALIVAIIAQELFFTLCLDCVGFDFFADGVHV